MMKTDIPKIRLSTVNKFINEWEIYKDFIVDLLMVNCAEDYKNLLHRHWEINGHVELACIACMIGTHFAF